MNAPITVVQSQTFTGTCSISTPVSMADWPTGADWTLFVTISGCFAGVVLVSIEDSADGFAEDIQTIVAVNVTGPVNAGTFVTHSWRARELPSYRVGHLGATTRISVTSESSGASLTLAIGEIK